MRRAALTAIAVLIAVGSLLAAGSAAGDPGDEKQQVDARLGDLRGQLDAAAAESEVLTSELSAISDRARVAQAEVDTAQARLQTLESQLARQRARLSTLDALIDKQTRKLERLAADQRVAVARLEERVRELYMSDAPDFLSFMAGAESFSDILDNIELLRRISRQDERIVTRVREIRAEVTVARRATKRTRAEAAEVEREIAGRTAEQREVTTRLVASRDALVAARAEREAALATIRDSAQHLTEEVEALERESAALAATIRKAQEEAAAAAAAAAEAAAVAAAAQPAAPSPDPSTPEAPAPTLPSSPTISGSRLSWPVSGPVVSGFGPRGGRLHEGIDIIVPEGTPVVAAADGVVAYVGWLGGYGNLVVVDHGGGLSTAYAHNSSYASSVGQAVARGQVVAYSGNTGNSSGPHVHFEVRIDGNAVDPLGYL